MALITCKECGNAVSDTVKSCPQCGAKVKKSSWKRKLGIGLAVLIAFSSLPSLFGRHSPSTPNATTTPVAEESETDKLWKRARLISGCQMAWESAYKAQLKDPDSLAWDRPNAKVGIYKKKAVLVIPYRAKNGFNALTRDEAICEIDEASGETKALLK